MSGARRITRIVVAVVVGGAVSGSLAETSTSDAGEAGERRDREATAERSRRADAGHSTESDESSGAERPEARPSRSGVEVVPSLRRSPEQVRRAPVAFESDLRPIGERRARTFLSVLCSEAPERASLEGRSEEVWACARCPAFTSKAGSEGPFVLDEIVRGSFTAPGEREAFVTYRGCEPKHAAYGGAAILRRRSEGWESVYRHPGLQPQACLSFSAEGHPDRLACRLRYEGSGVVVERVVDAATPRGAARLVQTIDNSAQCPKQKFISSYLVGWRREDVDGDGRLDLVVDKIQRQEPLGGEDDGPVCSLDESDGVWDRARKITFELRFTGEKFELHDRRHEKLPPAAHRAEDFADRGDAGSPGGPEGSSSSTDGD